MLPEKNAIKNDTEFHADVENFIYAALFDFEKDILNKWLALLNMSFTELFVGGLDVLKFSANSIEVDILNLPQSEIIKKGLSLSDMNNPQHMLILNEYAKLSFKIYYLMTDFLIGQNEIPTAIVINNGLINGIEKVEFRLLEDLSPEYKSYVRKAHEQNKKLTAMIHEKTTPISIYDINTGEIFQRIKKEWRKFDREFLEDLESDIETLLIRNGIVTARYRKGENEDYISHYQHVIEPEDVKRAETTGNFPMHNFFLHYYKVEDEYPSIVSFDSAYIVSKDEHGFAALFAVKLSLTDEFEISNFLMYQFEENFNSHASEYKEFLQIIFTKYGDFLMNGKTNVLTDKFITEKLNPLQKIESKEMQQENEKEEIPLKWTNEKSKNDFVKLIYALHEAKLINNGEGERTKIVEQAAKIFNVGLGKSWQSNFSKNKNDQNSDYNHTAIFDRLATAYQDYLKKNKKI